MLAGAPPDEEELTERAVKGVLSANSFADTRSGVRSLGGDGPPKRMLRRARGTAASAFAAPREKTDRVPDDFDLLSLGYESLGGDTVIDEMLDPDELTNDVKSFQETLGVPGPSCRRMPSAMEQSKPKEIILLENILTLFYDCAVKVTDVRQLPTTRKEVKEVYFLKGHAQSKVWVFEADPDLTAKELAIYHLIHQQGIPTGKPIGYTPTPNQKQYPFSTAILGGIVEHAGDSYDHLIATMRMEPEVIHQIAITVAGLIADYHFKLTRAEKMFGEYGINVERCSPRQEIRGRFVAGLGIDEVKAEKLIRACESLYEKQNPNKVISHGDLHTGNVVTVRRGYETFVNEFGVIDWGSLTKDHPYGDLQDFWLHHKRQAEKVCYYDFGFSDMERAYEEHRASLLGTYDQPFDQKDSLIQSALWNLYEMYDPVRTDEKDIREKAVNHLTSLKSDLEKLELYGFDDARTIMKEMQNILKGKYYLASLMD